MKGDNQTQHSMKSEVILKHESLTLTYYPEASCILETWNGFTSFELFSELLEEVLKLMIQKGAKNLILDTRLHKGLSPKGQEHGVNRQCLLQGSGRCPELDHGETLIARETALAIRFLSTYPD
jgi:hypothetical protein